MTRVAVADGRRRIALQAALALPLAACGLPVVAQAQTSGRIPRVGVLGEQSADEPRLEAFRQGLRAHGYVEGQSVIVEYRFLRGGVEQAPELLAELLRLNVDVLVVGGTVAAQAAKALTTTLPIVFAVAADPVGSGLVASLAHPGRNLTGQASFLPEIAAKQLELLKAAVPKAARVAVLYNPVNPVAAVAVVGLRSAAHTMAIGLQVLEVRQRSELSSAFAALKAGRAGAVLVVSDPLFGSELARLARLVAENRLPAIYNRREFAELGGLLAYGPSFSENYRRAAAYVDKILKGSKPSDLPVEQPTKFELVVNLNAAKALGLTIPQALLLRADEVIQ